MMDYCELEIKKEDEIKAIRNEADYLEMQPYGHYIVVNDLDFTDQKCYYSGADFNGILDFNGHIYKKTSKVSVAYMIHTIGEKGIVENLVLNIRLNHEKEIGSFMGIYNNNLGIVRNIQVNLIESKPLANTAIYIIGYMNNASGILENFVVNMQEPIYGANLLFPVMRYNRGTIQNGYVYGKDVEAIFPLASGQTRTVGIVAQQNYVKGIARNIYTLASINTLKQEGVTDDVANMVVRIVNGCKVENAYSVGIGNISTPTKGPNSTTYVESGLENTYYFADQIFKDSISKITTKLALWDTNFQNQVLNKDNAFNVDELVKKGYYPHIIMPDVMPRQEYNPLPDVKNSELTDIMSIEVLEQKTEEATILCNVHNPSGENITEIKVENITANIIKQEYEEGVSKVTVKLTEPIKYVSKYSVMSITSQGAFETSYTRNFEQNERVIEVELYRTIYNVEDWKKIKQSPTENYKIMEDLNFINEGNDIIISSEYSGKIDGNGHTIKNINVNQNLFFRLKSASLINLNIENIKLRGNTTSVATIGDITYSKIENVHIKQIELQNVGQNPKRIGGITGLSTASTVQNCSVKDVNINIDGLGDVYVGGMIGWLTNSYFSNNYATNINIVVNNIRTSNGIGGIGGNIENTTIEYCYAQGNIKSGAQNIGGIIGKNINDGNIINCYSVVNIESEGDYIGGIEGNEQKINNSIQDYGNLAIGNLYSKNKAEYFNRIIGTKAKGNNYAYEGQLINGLKSTMAYDAILLTEEQLKDKNTYTSIIGWQEGYDCSQVNKGILPKIYYKGTMELLPNQDDIYIKKPGGISVDEIDIEKTPNYVTGRLEIDNTQELPILEIKVEDMQCEIIKQNTLKGKTYIEFKATPTKYYDSYKIYEIKYEENGQEKSQEVSLKIDAQFYKEIYNFEDWQTIENGTYQNYRLMNDIDFENRENIKTEVTIGRLEAEGERKKIKNLKLSINQNDTGFIKNIQSSMKNITFENIEINCNATVTNIGIIGNSVGIFENIEFTNIKINAKNATNLGMVGNMNYGKIDNIILKDIEIIGKEFVGALVGRTQSMPITNITANNITVTGNNYIGGIIGYRNYEYDGNDTNIDKRIGKMNVDNVTLIGKKSVGGIIGYGIVYEVTLTNSNITGTNNVGGIVGYGVTSWDTTNMRDLTLENSTIQGSESYIGGIVGYSQHKSSNYKNSQVINCNIIGTTVNSNYVGGIVGSTDISDDNQQIIQMLGVINCTIISKGSYVGGILGQVKLKNGHLRFCFVKDTTIEGYSKVGGFIGNFTIGEIDYNYIKANIRATAHSAGGIVGYLDNTGMTNANNVSKVYRTYVAGSIIQAPEKVGGIIGDSTIALLTGDYYHSNLIEANILTENIQTASFGIGGRKKDSKLTNTYVYKYSSINSEYINTINDTFEEQYYVTLENLKTQSFYTSKLGITASYFDYTTLKQNKYPTIKNTYNECSHQTAIDLPEEPAGISLQQEEAQNPNNIDTVQEELPQITAYSVGVNKLNIDLSTVTRGAKLKYKTENKEEESIEIQNRTYTFEYDYQNPITLTLQNDAKEETIEIKPEEVINTASIKSNQMAYLEDEKLIVNGQEMQGNYTNLMEGKALLETGEIYNITENKIEEESTEKLALIETQSKEQYEYKGNKIETYGTYSKINDKEVEAIYELKNQKLSVTDGKKERIQSDKIVDNYNDKEYETILAKDGKMYDLKDTIKYPEDFKNENIKTLALDNTNEKREVMVYYENGSVVVFDYMTGEKAYEQKNEEKIDLWQYMQNKIDKNDNTNANNNTNIQDSYKTSKLIEEKLKNKPITSETEKNATYITMYNSETDTHEIYTEQEILNLGSEETKSETEKIQESEELKEYYLNTDPEEAKPENIFYLVIASIIGAIITLIILRKIKGN